MKEKEFEWEYVIKRYFCEEIDMKKVVFVNILIWDSRVEVLLFFWEDRNVVIIVLS